MSKALVSGPARMLAIYGGISGLAYVETDGFRRSAPFITVLPLLVLGFMAMSLTMKWKTKYLTASSFFVEGDAWLFDLSFLLLTFGRMWFLRYVEIKLNDFQY